MSKARTSTSRSSTSWMKNCSPSHDETKSETRKLEFQVYIEQEKTEETESIEFSVTPVISCSYFLAMKELSEEHTGNPWRRLSRRVAYENPWICVNEDQVIRPDGKNGIYGVVH